MCLHTFTQKTLACKSHRFTIRKLQNTRGHGDFRPFCVLWAFCSSNFFPTCQVRVVRFYVSCLLLLPRPPPLLLLLLLSSWSSSSSLSSLSSLSSSSSLVLVLVVLVVLAQLRPAIHSVLCRTSTTTTHAQCSLPDLICEYPCQVFPAGPM